MIYSLNEDFFDDESVSQNIDLDDDFETSAAEMGLDVNQYKYYINISFCGVPKKHRDCAKSYADLIMQFQKMILTVINHSDLIENHTNIVFSLEDNKYNAISLWKGERYNWRFKQLTKDGIPHPETFDMFGVNVYNDPIVWDNKDNLLSEASQFSATFSFNVDVKQSRLIIEFMRIFNALQKICVFIDKNIHPINIRIVQNNDTKKKRFNCSERGLIDIMNKNDNNSVRNYLKTLYNVIFDINLRYSQKYIDRYISKSAYSKDVIELVKALEVKDITTLYIDEDEKSIRITIPNGVAVKPYFTKLYNIIKQIENSGKYVSLFVEGKITIDLPFYDYMSYKTNLQNSFFFRNLSFGVNELVISVRWYNEKTDEIDLSSLQIQDLKIKYSPLEEYTWRNIQNGSKDFAFPIVKLNPTYAPKKLKVYDNFAKKCPAAKSLQKGKIWWN